MFHAEHFFRNRIVYRLIVKPKFWNEPTYISFQATWEAMLQHAQKHKIEMVGVPKMSTAIDKPKCLKLRGIITDVFHNSPVKVTVYTQAQQENATPSGTQKEKKTTNETQQAQEDNQSLGTALSCVKTGKRPHGPTRPVKNYLGPLEQF